jgi:hypothetical protein
MAFEKVKDYKVALLRFMAKMPDHQGDAREISESFEQEHRDRIPPNHYETLESGAERWHTNVSWARYHLAQAGLLDSPRRGVWRITQAGLDWVQQNPTATRIATKASQRRRGRSRSSRKAKEAAPGITLEMLEQTRRVMPADQFRQVWGPLYDQLLADERAKAITAITKTELGRRTRYWLDDVHAFLSGENASPPSSEALCDWVHFCYALELYREAAAMFPYVREDEVDAAIYKRAKRVAEVCRRKLAG